MLKKLFILTLLLPLLTYSQNKIYYKIFYDADLEQNGLKVQADYILTKPSDTISFILPMKTGAKTTSSTVLQISKDENPDSTIWP